MYCCCQKCLLYVTTVCCVSVSCLLLLQAYIITSYIPTLNKEVLFSLFELIVLVSCLVWSAEESRITKDLWPDVVHHCGDMTAVWMLFLLQADWPQQSAVDRLRCWFDRDLDVGWTGDLLNTEATGVVCSSCRRAEFRIRSSLVFSISSYQIFRSNKSLLCRWPTYINTQCWGQFKCILSGALSRVKEGVMDWDSLSSWLWRCSEPSTWDMKTISCHSR